MLLPLYNIIILLRSSLVSDLGDAQGGWQCPKQYIMRFQNLMISDRISRFLQRFLMGFYKINISDKISKFKWDFTGISGFQVEFWLLPRALINAFAVCINQVTPQLIMGVVSII